MNDGLEKVRADSRELIEARAGDPYKHPAQAELVLSDSIKRAAQSGYRMDDISDASGYRVDELRKIVGS